MPGLSARLNLVAAWILLFLTAACSSDVSTQLKGVGTLTVTVHSDTRLLQPGGEVSASECPVYPESEKIILTMEDATGAYSHTWESIVDFTQNQSYFAGTYTLSATCGDPVNEGFDTPAFAGSTMIEVTEDQRADASISLSPVSAFFRVSYSDETLAAYPGISLTLHSATGAYIPVIPGEKRFLCLNPSVTEVILDIPLPEGNAKRIMALELSSEPTTLYDISVVADSRDGYPIISVSCEHMCKTVTLSPGFLESASPSITLSDSELTLPEGDFPLQPVIAEIHSGDVPISSVLLTTRSASLEENGFPTSVDLLAPSPEFRLAWPEFNLTSAGGTVDFSNLLSKLVYLSLDNAQSEFHLLATDENGVTSEPVCLRVNTTPVEIEVGEPEDAIICIDRSSVIVRCPAPGFERNVRIETESTPGQWIPAPLSITPKGSGAYELAFNVPEGSAPVNTRILYCDEVRGTFTVRRAMPRFTIEVDAFSRDAIIEVRPDDPALRARITERLSVYVDGTLIPVYRRYPEEGRVLIIDLDPATTYSFAATLMEGVQEPELTPPVKALTERSSQLPNADFEERRSGPSAKQMPSGGLYARTTINIFNWQHHTDFSCEVPKGWANTNEKTFNLSASNINTWYLQPSVVSVKNDATAGAFSVMLTSVGFDPAGEEIPPYSQKGQPYLDYSPIVPDIRYRAAGKLFLGEYKYNRADGTETYNEGITWSSRPSALSGNYKFIPASNGLAERGLAKIEVLGNVDGKEQTIASGTLTLPYSSSFSTFNIPLTYLNFGVKATRLRVMFASSANIGTIEEETLNIATVSDPLTASSTGGRLWIDDIRLIY